MMPANAHADMFSSVCLRKSGIVNGTGTAFTDLNSSFGSGAEAGIELIGIDIFGEALKVGEDQFYFTANLGFDVTFGEKWRWTLGAHTGPMVFMSPHETSSPSRCLAPLGVH